VAGHDGGQCHSRVQVAAGDICRDVDCSPGNRTSSHRHGKI
jgi:hypothetical protein